MFFPLEIPGARVLITVKTYPLPSRSYGELVCTAGLLDGKNWIRIYPIPFRLLSYESQYPKYSWITLDLIRNKKDFRPESFKPRQGVDEPIQVGETIGPGQRWEERKRFVLPTVEYSMTELIARAKSEQKVSLATIKPKEIIDFVIEPDEREWKPQWLARLNQLQLFDVGAGGVRKPVRKLPYRFSYRFVSEGDSEPRTMMIEDWEIGALFWNCLNRVEGDEGEAVRMVRAKYLDQFVARCDVHLFVGTTKEYHNVGANPFVIVGVFYPPKTGQMSLF